MPSTKRVAVATPVRSAELFAAQVTYGYAESLRKLSHEMGLEVIDPAMAYSLDAMRARNRVAAYVLREMPQITHVLWWDDDQWPEDRRIVQEMLDSGADVVGAAYTNKQQPLRPTYAPLIPSPPREGPLQEVKWLPFGFTITSVRALQWMSDECSRRMTGEWRTYTDGPKRHKVASLFNGVYAPTDENAWRSAEDEALLSEDYSFSERWRQLGGKCYLYAPSGVVYHAGPHAFSAREMAGGVVG